jgi:nitrogen fixation protein FixH
MKRNPWPYAIVGYFAVVIAAMASWITFAVRNDMELVRKDYYEHEIKFQQQIDRLERTAAIKGGVAVNYDPKARLVSLRLPANADGEVHLYRPSDSKLDRRVKLDLDAAGSQTLNVAELQAGLWRMRFSWEAEGKEFYFEEPLIIEGK